MRYIIQIDDKYIGYTEQVTRYGTTRTTSSLALVGNKLQALQVSTESDAMAALRRLYSLQAIGGLNIKINKVA